MPSLASLAVAALGGGLLAASADAAALRAAPAAAPTMMNITVFTDDKCTAVTKVQTYELSKCKKSTIATCEGKNATLSWYADSDKTCAGAVNSTKSYVTDECTPTGPKGAKLGRKAVCY